MTKSPEDEERYPLVVLGFYLSRCAPIKGAPPEMKAKTLRQAVNMFRKSIAPHEEQKYFYNKLKGIRDRFDAHLIDSGRRGWRQRNKPSQLPKLCAQVQDELKGKSKMELWELVRQILPGMPVEQSGQDLTYLARVAWNTNRWMKPSGESPKLEAKSYASTNGFGHEEWLGNPMLTFESWRYGFVEGVGMLSDDTILTNLSLKLFSLGPARTRYYVGTILGAEVIDDNMARKALDWFVTSGVISKMIEDIASVGGNRKVFEGGLSEPKFIFNIRFKPEHLTLYDHMIAAKADDKISKFGRYGIMYKETEVMAAQFARNTRAAAAGPLNATSHVRNGAESTEVDQLHKKIQNEISEVLGRDPANDVKIEKDYVDIQVTRKDSLVIIEVKIAKDARAAIREALGQLLDYSFYRGESSAFKRLFVVGQHEMDVQTGQYLARLRNQFDLPIEYRKYEIGTMAFSIQ